MRKDFYVYIHFRPSTGEPFYVGKGSGVRFKTGQGWNIHWNNITDTEGGFYWEFVAKELTQSEAYALEKEVIKELDNKYELANIKEPVRVAKISEATKKQIKEGRHSIKELVKHQKDKAMVILNKETGIYYSGVREAYESSSKTQSMSTFYRKLIKGKIESYEWYK